MGLFDKKECSICGGKIGLLGNRKLEDGNLCKDCSNKLSPFFTERKQSTVAEIREQLEYREANKEAVAGFNVSKILGNSKYVIVDTAAGNFMVNWRKDYKQDNPDVIPMANITGINIDTDTNKREIKDKDKDGNEVSFKPAHWEYDYDVNVTINVRHPYFSSISFKTGDGITIETIGSFTPDPTRNVEYNEAISLANEIKAALSQGANLAPAEPEAPKTAVKCPHCGATTVPDKNGRCEYCGGALQ